MGNAGWQMLRALKAAQSRGDATQGLQVITGDGNDTPVSPPPSPGGGGAALQPTTGGADGLVALRIFFTGFSKGQNGPMWIPEARRDQETLN